MSITRTPACTVKGCPAPRDPDWHVPICGHGLEGHHHHVIKRSQGGKDGPQVFICPDCHDNIDNGEWGNDVKDMPGRGLVYFAWDIHGNTLIEREVLSDGDEAVKSGSIIGSDRGDEGEADPTLPRGSEGILEPDSVAAHTSPPSPSVGQSKEESDERLVHVGDSGGGRGGGVHGGADVVRGTLTHEQRVAIAQEIHDTEWNRQWFAGDIGNLWIEQLGESAEQYLSDFGYQPESLANILRVCAAIKPAYRNGNLRFSHHVVVYDQPPEDRMRWLTECEAEQWSVAEFRRQVKGTKPRVKRYSVPELREEVWSWHKTWSGDRSVAPTGELTFLDWLGEQA